MHNISGAKSEALQSYMGYEQWDKLSTWILRQHLNTSSGPPKQPMDWLGPQGQQQHTTSWFVEAIHRARSFGGDATVLADYALTTTI